MQSVADGIVDASLISLSLDTNIGIAHPDLNTLPLMAAAIVPSKKTNKMKIKNYFTPIIIIDNFFSISFFQFIALTRLARQSH